MSINLVLLHLRTQNIIPVLDETSPFRAATHPEIADDPVEEDPNSWRDVPATHPDAHYAAYRPDWEPHSDVQRIRELDVQSLIRNSTYLCSLALTPEALEMQTSLLNQSLADGNGLDPNHELVLTPPEPNDFPFGESTGPHADSEAILDALTRDANELDLYGDPDHQDDALASLPVPDVASPDDDADDVINAHIRALTDSRSDTATPNGDATPQDDPPPSDFPEDQHTMPPPEAAGTHDELPDQPMP